MPKITFLAASEPLTKRITKKAEEIEKTNYPRVMNFSSHTQDFKSLSEFCRVLITRAAEGQCLLKGTTKKKLVDEPRAGSTTTDSPTDWVCFDLDRAPYKTPQEFMDALKLQDVSYIVQYSASHGVDKEDKTLNCHIFCFLEKLFPAPQLKAWLQWLNFNTQSLRTALRLSSTQIALSYPLDITCCQNDKLLYIAPPTFKGMTDPIKDRIQFVKKTHDAIPSARIGLHNAEALKKLARDLLNERRVALQLPKLNSKTVIVGEFEVQNNPGEMTITGGPKIERDFVYFNINGGRNWSYYHPVSNFELIHNFKSEPCVRTKEVFPEYYKQQIRDRNERDMSPSESGDTLLAFNDRRTGQYWVGTYNEGTGALVLDPAKSETQVDHFMLSHGKQALPFIPRMDRIFDPARGAPTINMDAKPYPSVNIFYESEYTKRAKKGAMASLGGCPTIARVIEHAVGSGPILDHFYNWLAVIFQLRVKPNTAWVLHGVQGTGKDTLIDRVLVPLIGKAWVPVRNQNELSSDFSGWLEYALVAHIREIDVDSLENGGIVESKLKSYITDTTVQIRKMRTDTYEVLSYAGLIFSSNKPQPVRIAQDDRRYNVGKFQVHKLEITIEELEKKIPEELQAFADYLASRKADRATAATPLRTEDRDAIIALGMTSADMTAKHLIDGDLEAMWEAMPDEKTINEVWGTSPIAVFASAFASIMRRCLQDYINRRESKLSREELGTIFQYCVGNVPTSPTKLSQYLAHHGLKIARMRIGPEVKTGVVIDWRCSEAFLEEVAAKPAPTVVSIERKKKHG